MKLKGLAENELVAALNHANTMHEWNLEFNRHPERKGNFLHFTLRVRDSSKAGAKRSVSGRRLTAACWHAHRDVMRMIFAVNPDALLVTALARYEGLDDFERKFPDTGDLNIGTVFDPLYLSDACLCTTATHMRGRVPPTTP